MFLFGQQLRNELAEARRKIAALQDDLNMQRKLAENRLYDLDALRKKIKDEARACSVAIDFEQMDAFSIERMSDDNGLSKTVVGYLKSLEEDKPEIGEWVLYCNDEIHEQLVEQFKQVKGL